MNLRTLTLSVTAANVLFIVTLAHAEDAGRPARGPIVYDSHWQVHHVDPGVRVHGEDADDRPSLRASTPLAPGALRDEMRLPQSATPTYMPPPQPPRPGQEERRRNWIVPTLDDDPPSYGPRRSEEEEPSGWGWLADDIGHRQRAREAELEEDEAQRVDAEREWLIQRDPARPGLFMGDSFAPSPLMSDSGYAGDDEERGRGRTRRGTASADLVSSERTVDTVDSRISTGSDDPYAVDPLGASSWELDIAQQQNGLTASSLTASLGETWNCESSLAPASMAPVYSSRREAASPAAAESVRLQDSLFMRPMTQGFETPSAEVTDSLGMSFGGGTDRAGFGMTDIGHTGFTPTSDFGTRWGADWSGDSGWQQGEVTEPARPSGITPQSPLSPGSFHNNGWLANPGR